MSAAYLRAPGPATPERVELPACVGKMTFATEGEAKRAIWRMGTPSQPFRCRTCRQWHISRIIPRQAFAP